MSFSPSVAGRTALSATLALALAACGGGGGSSAPPIAGPSPAPVPSPSPSPVACSVSEQIQFADSVLRDWYLFPDLLDNTVNQANFSTVQAYLDARVAPARAANRDQGFTFATSIAEENALINSGSSSSPLTKAGLQILNPPLPSVFALPSLAMASPV